MVPEVLRLELALRSPLRQPRCASDCGPLFYAGPVILLQDSLPGSDVAHAGLWCQYLSGPRVWLPQSASNKLGLNRQILNNSIFAHSVPEFYEKQGNIIRSLGLCKPATIPVAMKALVEN